MEEPSKYLNLLSVVLYHQAPVRRPTMLGSRVGEGIRREPPLQDGLYGSQLWQGDDDGVVPGGPQDVGGATAGYGSAV